METVVDVETQMLTVSGLPWLKRGEKGSHSANIFLMLSLLLAVSF